MRHATLSMGLCALMGLESSSYLAFSGPGDAALVAARAPVKATIRVGFRHTGLFPRHWIVVDELTGEVVLNQRLGRNETAYATLRTDVFGTSARAYYRHTERETWTYLPFLKDEQIVEVY